MWTDYRCVKCMKERPILKRLYSKMFQAIYTIYPDPDDLEGSRQAAEQYKKAYNQIKPRGKCDGHCRKVSKPHNLDSKAYGIDGEDSRTERDMIGKKKSLLDT